MPIAPEGHCPICGKKGKGGVFHYRYLASPKHMGKRERCPGTNPNAYHGYGKSQGC